jgi:hypothetical protein
MGEVGKKLKTVLEDYASFLRERMLACPSTRQAFRLMRLSGLIINRTDFPNCHISVFL